MLILLFFVGGLLAGVPIFFAVRGIRRATAEKRMRWRILKIEKEYERSRR